MILKYLHIHNIASIADAEIDFKGEILGDASIFLITGETGAGKSTILDAICLALYDKTPRMTSVAKEDIGAGLDNDDKYYFNDNSQFLRRGTGEGWVKLKFDGNDGKEYEATWAIQRNYKKPDRRLQKPTRSLTSEDGIYAETNKRVIPDKIIELTGLDYDQFCRTVMLAQGDFSKFLKSEKGEKSEILEKLTGTEIYSIIGRKIATHYLEKKREWEEIKLEIKNITLLTEEEKLEKKQSIDNLNKESCGISKNIEEIGKKVKWFQDIKNLNVLKSESSARLEKLEAITKSESYLGEETLIKDYNLSEEARQMYREKESCRNLLNEKEILFVKLQENIDNCAKAVEAAESEVKKIQKEIEEKLKYEEKLNPTKINDEMHNLNKRLISVGEVSVAYVNLNNSKSRLDEFSTDFKSKQKTVDECDVTIKTLSDPIKTGEKRLTEASSDLAKIELATSEAVKSIRMSVKEGDMCPVCGATIEKRLEESLFSSMLLTLSEKKKVIEQDLLQLKSKDYSAKELKKDTTSALKVLYEKIEKQTKKVAELSKEFETKIKECGYGDIPSLELPEIIQNEKMALNNSISELRKTQKEAEELRQKIAEMQRSLKKVMLSLEKKKEESVKSIVAMSEWKIDKKNIEEKLNSITEIITNFLNCNNNITESRLKQLSGTDKETIDNIECSHKKTIENINRELGALTNISNQISALELNNPEFEESESEESLNERIASFAESLNRKQREIGQLKEQLEKDETARKSFEKKIKKEEEAREEKEKWEGLYRLLGDTDGIKFRNVAQSFVLHSLLDNANMYMRNFTDRYTLTCNPGSLAILVKDCYHPSEPQPASILSGGESFMASLSLALSLSNMRSGGGGADVLFIDEGFGTLSPEYLGNVMDTLEKLHQIGGRKVGLISHVPEMKERIPVQINVNRESPALSRVSICCLR